MVEVAEKLVVKFLNGRLSFHPIPCGTALFGHVIPVQLARPTVKSDHASHSSHSLVSCVYSCSMRLARWLLSSLLRDLVYKLYQSLFDWVSCSAEIQPCKLLQIITDCTI